MKQQRSGARFVAFFSRNTEPIQYRLREEFSSRQSELNTDNLI
jgi:hypothetical protein